MKAAEALKTTPGELIAKAQSSMQEMRNLQQTIEKMKDKVFAGDVDNLMFSAKKVGEPQGRHGGPPGYGGKRSSQARRLPARQRSRLLLRCSARSTARR